MHERNRLAGWIKAVETARMLLLELVCLIAAAKQTPVFCHSATEA